MFERSKRPNDTNKNPGPGFYFQGGQYHPESVRDRYTFPREQRVMQGCRPRPDYDMSGFYRDKGPGIKQKIGGYTIPNTGGSDVVEDPSKNTKPGVGTYETKHAYSKTTFFKNNPMYSMPQDGSYSIEACLQRATSPKK